eukprot:m.440798 g.440798  ORF g.440798 m.440798 type:complete len:77 (-) comp124903_c0_seq1:501-731(-)
MVAGGYLSGGPASAVAEIYTPSTDTWATASASLPSARFALGLVVLPSGRVMACGGGLTPSSGDKDSAVRSSTAVVA